MKRRNVIKAAILLTGALLLTGCGKDADNELSRIQKDGVLKVGVEGTYPPITYHDENGDLTGFDVDLAKPQGEKLGVKVEFTESEWDSLLAAVDSGRIDTVINAVSITDERKEKYDFSEPYISVYRNIIVKGDRDDINSVADLNGKNVAENITTEYAQKLEEYGATLVPIDTLQQAFDLILSDRADFTVLEDIQFYPYLEEHPDANLKVAFTIDDDVDQFAIPIRKGETELVDAVNQALDELKEDGTLKEIQIYGKTYKGKELYDVLEYYARKGYYEQDNREEHEYGKDIMWYIWSNENSPVYGKEKMATFERYFIADKEELGKYCGKEFRASLAIQDENFAKALLKALETEEQTAVN